MSGASATEEQEQEWTQLDTQTRTLGRYTLFYEIGAGGMASVFLARESGPAGFSRWVAIKRVHPHLARESKFVEMFLDEARLAARITHPNVTQVLELGEAGGTWYLAMEYLHGETVAALAKAVARSGKRLPWGVIVRIAAQACEGLHHAHELVDDTGDPLRLVHRDVSPQNLLVTYGGLVKVMDFGIAKAAGQSSHTRTGGMKGKIAYMSPEQARAEPLDRRSDIFSLGVVLWELTTGRRLFKAESDFETMSRIVEARVPQPSSAGADIPAQLERAILRALSPRPEGRFGTAAEMQRELEALLASRGHVVGAAELSDLMRTTFADRIRIRERLLRTTTLPEGSEAPAVEVASGESLTFQSGLRERRPPPRRLPIVAAAGALAVLGVVVAAIWLGDRGPRLVVTPLPTTAQARPSIDPGAVSPVVSPPSPSSPSSTAPRAAEAPPARDDSSSSVPEEVPLGEARPTAPHAGPVAAPDAGASAIAGAIPREERLPPRPTPRRSDPPRPPADGASSGFLNVVTSPWSEVFVDGQRIGTTPLVRRAVPAGSHSIRLVWSDGRQTTARVTVRAGETTSLRRDAP